MNKKAATVALIALIGLYEGRSLVAYVDPVGIPTICDGWTHGVSMGDTATPAECDALTIQGIRDAEQVFDGAVKNYTGSHTTKAAFLSFIYNVGPGAPGVKDGFVWLKKRDASGAPRHSTMLVLIRAGEYAAACDQLPFWVSAGGKKLRGLVRRREAERELCHAGLLNNSGSVARPSIGLVGQR